MAQQGEVRDELRSGLNFLVELFDFLVECFLLGSDGIQLLGCFECFFLQCFGEQILWFGNLLSPFGQVLQLSFLLFLSSLEQFRTFFSQCLQLFLQGFSFVCNLLSFPSNFLFRFHTFSGRKIIGQVLEFFFQIEGLFSEFLGLLGDPVQFQQIFFQTSQVLKLVFQTLQLIQSLS